MYKAKETFRTKRGTLFLKGQKISNLGYFFLQREDKLKFAKEEQYPVASPPRVRGTSSSKSSNSHYGYGPEPGYSSDRASIPLWGSVDNAPTPHHNHDTHDFGGYGGGSGGGAGASGDWGTSYDSGSSSYDSGSSDSGGGCDSGSGDSGGGCD